MEDVWVADNWKKTGDFFDMCFLENDSILAFQKLDGTCKGVYICQGETKNCRSRAH